MKKLNKQTSLAVAYAQNALAFLFLDASVGEQVKRVYLYGSAVRGQLHPKSDIDLFLDCNPAQEKKIEKLAAAAFGRFYLSKDYEKWKRLKFTFSLAVYAGELNQWELKKSIITEGLLLYSTQAEQIAGERLNLVLIELPKDKKRYLHLTRSLFGRREAGYKDQGILGSLSGEKLSSNVLLVPKKSERKLFDFFHREKVNYSFKEISVF